MKKKYVQIADNRMAQPSLSNWCLADISESFNNLDGFTGRVYPHEREGVYILLPSGNIVVACNTNVFEENERINTGISLYSKNMVIDGGEFALLVDQFTKVADAGDVVAMRAFVLYDGPKQGYEDDVMKADDLSVLMGVPGLTDIRVWREVSEADCVKGGASPFTSTNHHLKAMAQDVCIVPEKIMEATESINQPNAMQM